MPVALELEHHVDQVLQDARAGDLAVLGDVADQYGGDVALFRDRDQGRGDRPDLGHPAGYAVGAGRGDGLYRVDDQQPGPDRVEVPEQRLQVGLGGQVQPLVQGTEPLGPQAYLAGGLLARDDQGRAARPGGPLLGDVEQQGGLADAGLAGQEDDRPGDQSATEYPVQLAHAGRPVPGRLSADRGDRSGRFQRRPGGETAQGRREAGTAGRVDDRAPLAALGTAADPLRGPVPAGVALVGRPGGSWLGGCHERTVPGGYDRISYDRISLTADSRVPRRAVVPARSWSRW